MVFPHELDLFYNTSVECSYSKCKGLNVKLRCVILSNFINDQLPKVDGLIHPTVFNNLISDIEKTRRNTSMRSIFENLEAKSITFPPKLANPSPYVESMEISYSDPKYDINTTQNISTRRSKKLYELRAKMSKYTPKYVQLLEGSNDFPLHAHLQSKYQTCYNQSLYGAWPSSMPMHDIRTEFSFCGNSYMIAKSKIDVANLGLLILSHVFVPPKQLVALMPFGGPLQSRLDYLNIVK